MQPHQTSNPSDNPISEADLLTELEADTSNITFEPLGDASASNPQKTPNAPLAKIGVIPFTDEEIVDGSAFITMIVAQRALSTPIESQEQVELYMQAYKNVFAPFASTPALIAPLKLGDALARYGIGKNMQPGTSLEVLPPLVRITVGGVVLGVSSFMAMQAVKRVEEQPKQQPEPPPTTGGDGVDSAGDQNGS